MKRLAVVLAALLALPAVAGWQKVASGWTKISASPVSAPTTGLTAGRVVLSNGATSITDDAGLTYAVATDVLAVASGKVTAANLTASGLATPGGITVVPTLSQIGAITAVAGSALADGDALSVGDGTGIVPMEFDAAPGDGTTGGAIAIIFDGTETATEIRDAIKAILDASGRDWTTSNQGADGIGIVRATPGATGGAITEAVTAAGFLVTDWTDPTHATTVTYQLVACLADGSCTQAGADSTTGTSTATLSASNYNALSWSAVTGAASYDVYRTVGGATQGKILSASTLLAISDTGLPGGGETAPTVDGTGVITADTMKVGGQAIIKASSTSVAFGKGALLTDEGNAVAIGANSLAANTYGVDNTAVGTQALWKNTEGTANTAVGLSALALTVLGNDNTAVGKEALLSYTGNGNTAVGSGALSTNATGTQNTATGYNALNATTGGSNTAVGYASLDVNAGGASNTAVGANSLGNNTTGASNTAIGNSAGTAPGGVSANRNTTGSTNTYLGTETGANSTTQRTNTTTVGYRALSTADNQVSLGNSSVTEVLAGAGAAKVKAGKLNLSVLGVYADNAAALAGGLVAGDVYRTSTGVLMVTY